MTRPHFNSRWTHSPHGVEHANFFEAPAADSPYVTVGGSRLKSLLFCGHFSKQL